MFFFFLCARADDPNNSKQNLLTTFQRLSFLLNCYITRGHMKKNKITTINLLYCLEMYKPDTVFKKNMYPYFKSLCQ